MEYYRHYNSTVPLSKGGPFSNLAGIRRGSLNHEGACPLILINASAVI